MKESKHFFNKDIRLNKGYTSIDNKNDTSENHRKKYAHILPPIDLITEFEDIHPGTLARIIEMAESEQRHNHALNIADSKSQDLNIRFGKVCSVIVVALICVTTSILAMLNEPQIASLFAISLFAFLITSYLFSRSSNAKRSPILSAQEKPRENTKHYTNTNSNNNFKSRRKIK